MNRTFAYVSVHARAALRSASGSSICRSCSIALYYPRSVDPHISYISPSLAFSSGSIRFISAKQLIKERASGPHRKNGPFPLLAGESQPPLRRAKKELTEDERKNIWSSRQALEQARLKEIKTNRESMRGKKKTKREKNRIPVDKLPSPELAGDYSRSSYSFLLKMLIRV